MLDPNQEGENRKENEQTNTNRGKYYYQEKPGDNPEEITQEDIRSAKKNKRFLKMMDIFMQEEKKRYLLKLASQGAKLPSHFDVQTIITKEEETKNDKFQKKIQGMQDQLLKLTTNK